MRKLDKRFNSRKNTYVQLEDGGNYYVYGVWNLKDEAVGEPSYFEIFTKKVAKAATLKGIYYPEREKYPSDNDFGVWGWCCSNIDRVNYIKSLKLGVMV